MRSQALSVSPFLAAVAALCLAAGGGCSDGDSTGGSGPVARPEAPVSAPHQAGVALPGGLVTTGIGANCVECHEEIVRSYAARPMHDSLTLPSGTDSVEAGIVGGAYRDPDTGLIAQFGLVEGRYAQRMVYVDPMGTERASFGTQVDLIVGSGRLSRSYFAVRDGRLLEMPLTWFRELDDLALSPDLFFRGAVLRAATIRCVACHTGTVQPADTVAAPVFHGEISTGITCSRCHGPDEPHVASGEPDDTIHPAKLTLQRQSQLCEQCHSTAVVTIEAPDRSIADYTPGADLADWLGLFAVAVEDREPGVSEYAGRLQMSRCFTAGGQEDDPLLCTTCHVPHRTTAHGVAVRADARCTTCHTAEACTGDEASREGRACFSCHMTRSSGSSVSHTRPTDHWIRKQPTLAPPPPEPPHAGHLAAVGLPLVNVLDPENTRPGAHRRLASAYVRGIELARLTLENETPDWDQLALRLTADEAARAPDDPFALALRGRALTLTGSPSEGLPWLRKAYAARSDVPWLTAQLAYAEGDAGNFERATELLQEANAQDPYDGDIATALASALGELERRAEALDVLARTRERLGPSLRRGGTAEALAAAAGDHAAALEHLYDVLLFQPLSPDALTRAGELCIETGDEPAARRYLSEALRVAPDFAPARRFLRALDSR